MTNQGINDERFLAFCLNRNVTPCGNSLDLYIETMASWGMSDSHMVQRRTHLEKMLESSVCRKSETSSRYEEESGQQKKIESSRKDEESFLDARDDALVTLRTFFKWWNQEEPRITIRLVALEKYTKHMEDQGLRSSTICHRVEVLSSLLVTPIDENDCINRLRERRFISYWKRKRGEEGVTNVKPLFDVSTFERIIASQPRQGCDRESFLLWRVAFTLLVLTGSRPRHLLGIKDLVVLKDRIRVVWGPRKIHVTPVTDGLDYLFEWTLTPGKEMLDFMTKHGAPKISTPNNIASSCNSWLASLGTGLTRKESGESGGLSSCCPRVFLSTALSSQVEQGLMSKEKFALLMDHNIESAMTFYHRHSRD